LREDGDNTSSWQAIPAPEGTAIKSTGEAGGTKFLREDGDGTCSWQTVTAGTGDVSKVGTPADNQIGVWTGNGTIEGDSALTFNTATDTLAIGASGKLAFGAVTILDDTTGTTTLSNIDAIDATTEATIEAAIDALSSVVLTSPTITTGVTPTTNDGAALGSTANQFSDLFLAEGGVINWDNGDATLTQAGNDVTLAGASLTARVKPRTGTTTSSATPTINTDDVDFYSITAQTEAITSFTTNLSGTPTEGQKLWIAITGTGARAITWGASFEASTVALPTTTVSTNRLDVGFVWNTVTSKWRCIASC
jgi:hypothetical protein